jgi:hypothetical protein
MAVGFLGIFFLSWAICNIDKDLKKEENKNQRHIETIRR